MLENINNDSLGVSKCLIFSLAKYVIRIGARCMFFAVFNEGPIGELDHLALDIEIEKMTQIDMDYLCLMGQDFEN